VAQWVGGLGFNCFPMEIFVMDGSYLGRKNNHS